MKTIAIAVDFDGVIHRYSGGWKDGSIYDPPMPGALDGIFRLMRAGYAVFCHSTRDAEQIVKWFRNEVFTAEQLFAVQVIPEDVVFWNERYTLGVTNRKLPAIAYIDDRAYTFTAWDQVAIDFGVRDA